MKTNHRGFGLLLPLVFIGLILIIGGVYFLYSKAPSTETLANHQAELTGDIVVAKKKVVLETNKLKNLQAAFGAERPGNSAFQDDYAKLSSAVNSTDGLFNFRTTSNPQLKVKTDTDTALAINADRKQVAALLAALEKKRDASLSKDLSLAYIQEMKSDAEVIAAYIDKLKDLVASLTPAGSDISQSEIDTDRALVAAAAQELANLIASLDALTPTLPPVVTVTEDDIAAQARALAEAQAQLALLEAQLAANHASSTAPQSSGSSDVTPPASTPAAEPPPTKPGPPQLIEGSNKN